MGVQTQVILHARTPDEARDAAAAAFAEVARLERLMSDYRPSSQLSAINAGAGSMVEADDSMVDILRQARDISELTEGAFDATVGPAVALWRESRKRGTLPAEADRAAAVALINWREVEVGQRRVGLGRPGMKLDLGGIAKGYAAERAIATLRRRGVRSALVALAGDVALGDAPPGKPGWRVALSNERTGTVLGTITLANACVSTSGDSEQFVEIEGRRFAHIVDPRSGLGVAGGMPVTVVAPGGATADAIATGAFVLGADRARGVRLPPGVTMLIHRGSGPEFVGASSAEGLEWKPAPAAGAPLPTPQVTPAP